MFRSISEHLQTDATRCVVAQHSTTATTHSAVEGAAGTESRVIVRRDNNHRNTDRSLNLTNLVAPTAGQKTILLAEDEEGVRRFAVRFLEINGYRVLPVADATQAIEIWEREKVNIDILLTDLQMPNGMDGCQLAQKLIREKPNLKIIFSSGLVPDSDEDDMRFLRRQAFLQKPYNLQELLGIVKKTVVSGGLLSKQTSC